MTLIETTYGSAAVESLRATVAGLKTIDPMVSVVVIAPNNIAGIALAAGVGGRASQAST